MSKKLTMQHGLEVFEVAEIRLTAQISEGLFNIGKAACQLSLEQTCDVFVEVFNIDAKLVKTVEVKYQKLQDAIKETSVKKGNKQ